MTIMDRFRQRLSEKLTGTTFTRPSHIAIGWGLASEEEKEARKLIQLVSELYIDYSQRQLITSAWLSEEGNHDTARFSCIFTQGYGNYIWKEIGLVNSGEYETGDLLVRDENADGYCTKDFDQVKVIVVKVRVA